MRLLKKQSAWCIVLILGVAAIAIPVVARVSSHAMALVAERQANLHQQSDADIADTGPDARNDKSLAFERGLEPPQIRYDRRRQYLEDRVERRLDRRQEYLDRQTGGDDDDDEDDGADSRDDGGDDDEDDSMDQQEEIIERRREYLRDRVERRW